MTITPATGDGRARPAQQAPFRRVAGVLILAVVLSVEVALGSAYFQLRRASADIIAVDSLSAAFTDVQRMFQELEFLAVTEPRFDTPAVDEALALLERQVTIAGARLDDPDTTPQLRADIIILRSAFEELQLLRDDSPENLEAAFALADAGQRASQAAVDRTAAGTRAALRSDADAATLSATVLAVLGGVVLFTGVALLWSVLTHYQRSFDEAWDFAMDREDALVASNERLAEVAETRERFVSVLSHELRSPLAVIGAAGETLNTHWERLAPDVRQRMLESLTRQVARQQRMIDDLLLVARHANSEPEPDPEVVHLERVFGLMRADERVAGTAARYIADDDLYARVDAHHLEQAVRNLVRNAEKYGGDEIVVTATADGDQVVLRVEDDGPGVPESLRNTLFEPFTQAEETSKGGVGLGLSITRQLVEANGGSIEYCDRPGGGARFEIRLPRTSREPSEEAAST